MERGYRLMAIRFSDLKQGEITFVDLEPVRNMDEFGGNHLCIVVKKCSDKKTVIVLPLTSKTRSDHPDKIDITQEVRDLPQRFLGKSSIAALNQLRTVSVDRLQNIYDGRDSNGQNILKHPFVSQEGFSEVISLLAKRKMDLLSPSDQHSFYQNMHIESLIKQLLDTLFSVIRGKAEVVLVSSDVKRMSAILGFYIPDVKSILPRKHATKLAEVYAECLK